VDRVSGAGRPAAGRARLASEKMAGLERAVKFSLDLP
jgi:hypothetical protein